MVTLHTTYFGPIQWYQQLYRSDCVCIDGNERWQKQTIRNRCQIATANGIQTLSVPIVHHLHPTSLPKEKGSKEEISKEPSPSLQEDGSGVRTCDIRISNHGKWRREHWNALQSAYGESPFFDYYADDIRPFFTEEWEYLFDFNMAITNKMCELLDIDTQPLPKGRESLNPQLSARTNGTLSSERTLRSAQRDAFLRKNLQPYYQVYQQKHGFLPNLSILDLLFNMGNEAIFYL